MADTKINRVSNINIKTILCPWPYDKNFYRLGEDESDEDYRRRVIAHIDKLGDKNGLTRPRNALDLTVK